MIAISLNARVLVECPRRVFLPAADARLIALNPETGKPCSFFGDQGTKPGDYIMAYSLP